MLLGRFKKWLSLVPPPKRAARPRTKRLGLVFHPAIDPLEDRRLLSVAPVAAPAAAESAVVGRSIFYNNSRFDGNNPAANAADDGAIAPDKSALLPGAKASFANYTSYSGGINGVMVDIAGLTGVPTADDFLFNVGNGDDPRAWADAPAPASISVRAGAGKDGSSRVTITWPDDAIKNQWLRVDVRATANTGLAQTDVFYFGNAIGESGNSATNAFVDTTDWLAPRNKALGLNNPVSISAPEDYNRDGFISAADEMLARRFNTGLSTALRLIAPDPTAVLDANVVGRSIFYNNSQFDGLTPGASASDDGAIATDKSALLPGGTATFANYTSYSRGINGVMIDIAGLPGVPTADDFDFRVGNDGTPSQWAPAPLPSSISVRAGAGAGGSARVTIIWPDNAIQKQWLQITVKATARTGLANPDVFYFGNAIGETGDSSINASVTMLDAIRIHGNYQAGPLPATAPYDVNRDRVVDLLDENIARGNLALTNPLVLINLVPQQPVPTAGESIYTDFASAAVVARNIFYNNSTFDGDNPSANAADDLAIAPDKSALLPGAKATLANYTSYSRGINGIMIDIAGLPAVPTADDFVFRVGNTADPSQWSAAPLPRDISVRWGAGLGGSDRVTITWADNVIQRQWLQVTVKASADTALAAADVFYFGNAIGESGDLVTVARVDGSDVLAARNALSSPSDRATLTASSDYNRDGIIDLADEWIAQRSSTSVSTVLQLIAAPAAPTAAPSAEREPLELFHRGDGGINVFFAPNLVRANDGTLLAIAEGRSGEDDNTSYALVLRRSQDGGQSWSPVSIITSIPPFTTSYLGNPSVVLDAATGQIFLLFVKDTSTVFVTSSSNDGLSWSTPIDITSSVKVTADGNPNPAAFSSDPWGWYATGPGHGIQLTQGPNAGRLLIACDHRLSDDRSGPSWSHVIYSDDHGKTWHLGGGLDQSDSANDYSNEATVVEQSDGTLYMSVRLNDGSSIRGFSRSFDGGLTWSPMGLEPSLTTFDVEASLLRVDANTVLLSAPDTADGTRHQMTLWVSHDDMQTWTKTKTVFYGYAGYSDMVLAGNDTVLLAYNRGHSNGNSWESIGLARFNLRWLESPSAPQFTWNFNEEVPGTPANIDGTSIQDYSPWDNRAQAQADTPAEAPRYVAGPGGNRALALTAGSDSVLLTPDSTGALQFAANDSFTIEITMRTSDQSGVIIGGQQGLRGWSLQLVNGLVQLKLDDLQRPVSITSRGTINVGNWHQIVVVRDTARHLLVMTIDGVTAAANVDTTTGTLASTAPIQLGAWDDGSGQLAFDVDTLRVTRAALSPADFLPANFVEPPTVAAPTARPGNPAALAGLQFWLPGYDPTRDFADLGFSDPVPLAPLSTTAVRSAIDASANRYHISVDSEVRKVLVVDDPIVGTSWLHKPLSAGAGQQWVVQDSNGTSPSNFDFVQNTGEFTISTYVKISSPMSQTAALFDTAQTTSVNSGFSLLLSPNGSLTFLISSGNQTIRFSETTAAGLVAAGGWYHIAVVGSGAGKPVTFYATPVSSPTVKSSLSNHVISGDNGTYSTDANHNLTIGSLSNTGYASFGGQMVDEAIYDRPLTNQEIQQLFDYTKSQ
jgi:sialidase-1